MSKVLSAQTKIDPATPVDLTKFPAALPVAVPIIPVNLNMADFPGVDYVQISVNGVPKCLVRITP